MDGFLNEKHKKIEFNEDEIMLFLDLVNSNQRNAAALIEIAKYTKAKNNKEASGISQKELRLKINHFNDNAHTVALVINFLEGASLIYYQEAGRFGRSKKYQLTKRGIQIVNAMSI